MTGLLLKDLYELKKLWLQPKFIVTSTIVIIAGLLFFSSSAILISIFVSVFFINTIQTLFVNDKKSGWILFVQTTNISSFKIIYARYLLSIIVCLATTLINASVSLILWFLYKHLSLKEYLILALIFLTVTLIYVFIMIPFFYAFDENGLTIGVLLCVLIAFLASRTPGFSSQAITYLQSITTSQITLIGVIMLVLLGALSFLSSILVFQKKG
ncbi:ABC-2 family transporter protein [Alkalibacterium subtropicum]|uniref:ABC-2 family transporter protein n=1 Tax=Alkalibacterium subtropicum TaxID=753702 RepID=A0A1I1IC83_9LACT|nr:ABC-2 transporter permease [Alkalibacterium subtropicum]SFC33705.1 ABC-2 family transporter protein [Alkalibacterium subtropicum]